MSGRQYIEFMWFTRPFSALVQRMPGACQICDRWPSTAICPPCASRFGETRNRCTTCARPLFGQTQQCGACLADRQPSTLALCVAAVDYAYPWDTLIARFKFRGEPALAQAFAALMLHQPAVNALLNSGHWVVPIPVTPSRLAERGYNQAWELAKAWLQQSESGIAQGLPSVLIRLGHAPDQHDLPAEQRVKNLKGAFACDPKIAAQLQGKHVILVDDVCTTGATLRAAAKALHQAGASQVSATVFARTAAD